MPIDSLVEIVTPENISFRYEVAGPFRRLPAFAMDLAIRALLFGCSLAVAIAMSSLVQLQGAYAIAAMFLLWFALEWFYGGAFEALWSGQTPGKRMMGLRVLTVDGHPINALQAVLRNVLRTADFMPLTPFFMEDGEANLWLPTLSLGLLCMSLSPMYQRLGDLVCGTMVVVEERVRFALKPVAIDPLLQLLTSRIPPHFRPTRRLSRAIAVYVDRRRLFTAARRNDIARHLAIPLLAAWDLPADTNHDLLLCAIHARLYAQAQVAA